MHRVLRPSEMMIFALQGVESNAAVAAAADVPCVTVRIAQESLRSFKKKKKKDSRRYKPPSDGFLAVALTR